MSGSGLEQTLHLAAKWGNLLRLQGSLALTRVAIVAGSHEILEVSDGPTVLDGLDVVHPKLLLGWTRTTVATSELVSMQNREPHITRNRDSLLSD